MLQEIITTTTFLNPFPTVNRFKQTTQLEAILVNPFEVVKVSLQANKSK